MSAVIPKMEENSKATPNQEALLRKIGKWVDGMTYEEASAAIDTLPKAENVLPGVWPAKISDIQHAVDKDKRPIKDKNGNPGVKISMKIRHSKEDVRETSSVFFYPATKGAVCPSQWRLAALKRALALPFDKEFGLDTVEKIMFFAGIKRIVMTDGKDPLKNTDGSERAFSDLIGNFWPYKKDEEGKGKPKEDGDPSEGGEIGGKFIEYKKKEGTVAAKAPEKSDFEDDELPTVSSSTPVVDEKPVEGGDW